VELLGGRWLVVVTVALLCVFAVSAWTNGELDGSGAWAMVVANTAPILFVRVNPLVVVLTFAITYPLWLDPLWGGPPRDGHVLQSLPTLLALYATGAWQRPLWLRAIGLVTPVWMLGAAVTGYWPTDVDELLYVALVLGIVWVLGVVDSGRRAYAGELERRTHQLEQAQRALADQAVAEERSRIARELHDVVAHAMSVITVQAGVGSHLIRTRPQQAADSLEVIERTGREALGELRRMLVVLRPRGRAELVPPQPGLADLPQLLDSARASGLTVSLTTVGRHPALSPGLDLTAYRIVQECLTNCAKHASGSRVDVRVELADGRLLIDVRDSGPGAPDGVRPGQGLTGMAERVALYDGTLGLDGDGGGFHVRASLLTDDVEAQ
jgi:signal transduction histidine kinase